MLGNQRKLELLGGQPVEPGGVPHKAPFISYMKGALLHCAA